MRVVKKRGLLFSLVPPSMSFRYYSGWPGGWVGGWVAGSNGNNANSASVGVEVEVEAELGKNKLLIGKFDRPVYCEAQNNPCTMRVFCEYSLLHYFL